MEPTPLMTAFRAQSGVHPSPRSVAGYRGAETAARFTDLQEEFSALRNGCGVYDLGFRAKLSLTGGDRTRWLNGMVTNNIRDLGERRGLYAFLLNPQGRILGDMHAYNLGESIVIETDQSQLEKITATFDHYIIMDDVEVKNISAAQSTLGLAGPTSRALLNAVGIEVGELDPLQMATPRCNCDCDCVECTVVRGENSPQESYELWLDSKDVFRTWQALVAAGAVPVGSEALELRRIVAGIPLYGTDIHERDLPQETEQMRALNFNKGCYVGQEIVERIRSRGNVHRTFSGFTVEGAIEIAAGARILAGEKEVGEVTSSAVSSTPVGRKTIAIGYIRREAAVPGREVSIDGNKATVTGLPSDAAAVGLTESGILHKA